MIEKDLKDENCGEEEKMIEKNRGDGSMWLTDTATRIGKRILISRNNRLYDRRHETEALQAISNMAQFNSQVLSRQQKRTAENYSREILGSTRFAPWLYVYTLVRGEFTEGWIPDNFFGRLVCPMINRRLPHIASIKSLANTILHTQALPDIAYFVDGVLYDRNMSVIEGSNLRSLFRKENTAVFVKPDGSARGLGVIKIEDGDIEVTLLKKIGDCVIQEAIIQHEFFDQIISSSVATIRITTVKDNRGTISMRAAYVRLGRKNTSWVQADNSLRVPVVSKSGDLGLCGYTQDWKKWSCHPDTGFAFARQRIPGFPSAVKLCVSLHKKIPHLSIIGWDVAIARDEVIRILEWNSEHPDIKFSEATTGPCFVGLNWESFKR